MNEPYAVDRKRWKNLSIFEQMGNTAAEVGRTIQAKNAGDEAKFKAALIRTLDLFEATVEAQSVDKPYRVKEILRAEDQFLQIFFGGHGSDAEENKLQNYFMQYAIAARLHR